MKLWLVRHAQPQVAPGVCYGASDLAADAQATQACAARLAEVLPQGLPVLASTLQRCEHLALALQGLRPDLALNFDARLAEMDFGHWEGQRWDAIPKAAFDAWMADFGAHRFGGRESVNELLQRVAAVHAEQVRQVAATGEAVWITHAGVIRAMTLRVQGVFRLERADQWPREAPDCGEWLRLSC
jgi:alpha-ribazole phosphatase